LTRVFLDANILIAASVQDGPARELMALAEQHSNVTLLTNEYGLDEAERFVQRFRSEAHADFLERREQVRACADPTDQTKMLVIAYLPRGVRLPRKDLPIMAGAVSIGADWLVTRDREDFGPLYGKTVLGVEVVRSGTARARLEQSAKRNS